MSPEKFRGFRETDPCGPFLESPELFGCISGDIVLFVSSKRRRLKSRNFVVILIFLLFKTYENTSFTESTSRSFRNGFPGPKSFRDIRETGHWPGSLGQNVRDILVKVGHHTVKVTLRY